MRVRSANRRARESGALRHNFVSPFKQPPKIRYYWALRSPSQSVDAKMSERKQGGSSPVTSIVTESKPKTKKPSMYKVLLLNDDYTPMEFVVAVLERIFHKSHEDATRIMLNVHQRGLGVCGVYPFDVAETKVTQVLDLAQRQQHPLQCTLEKE